jgi:ABC-2 type transport system permease protein
MKGTALATTTEVAVRTSEPPRLHVVPRLRELGRAREILSNLVRKEVKVKYKSSVLGMAWSMLNPILYLAVFGVVTSIVLQRGVPHFPIYLFSGLLAWNLFSGALGMAARSVVDNGNLVNKVYFPREVLPLASLGTALVDFGLQAIVFAGFMLIFRYDFWGMNLLLLPLAFVALLLFTLAVGMFVSAVNVRYRDTQHLLSVALLLWFWFTPIIYPSGLFYDKLSRVEVFGVSAFHLVLANPMVGIVAAFQRALYRVVTPLGEDGPVQILLPVSLGWLALLVTGIALGSLVLLWLGWRTFFRMSGDFAEEL